MSKTNPNSTYEARLLRVLAYIHDNLDGDLGLDALAEVACMSPYHWHRVFRAVTGETPAEAIRRIRLLKAANALVNDSVSLADAAKLSGYPNVASFSRAFRSACGTSPGAFRDNGVQMSITLRQASGEYAMHPVSIEDLQPERAAGVLHVGPYMNIGKAFQHLGGVIAARNLFSQVKAMIAVYRDVPGSKPDAELRAHAAAIIADGFPADIDGFEYFDLVGGKHAIMAHKGPYATLSAAYDWLYGKWLPQSGEEPRDAPPVELYVNNPMQTPPEELRTDIRLPLK